MRFPPSIPAHAHRMFADAVGNLWLQEYRLPGDDGAPLLRSVFDTGWRSVSWMLTQHC